MALSASARAHAAVGVTIRARVAIAAGDPKQAGRDARDALALGAEIKVYVLIPDILECLAALAGEADSPAKLAQVDVEVLLEQLQAQTDLDKCRPHVTNRFQAFPPPGGFVVH
ncbi:MAG: hypothetical protein ABSD32_24845 [Mycobacterium sp.]|jgi:hypothetical protein